MILAVVKPRPRKNPAEQKEVDSEAEAAGRFSCRMKAKL